MAPAAAGRWSGNRQQQTDLFACVQTGLFTCSSQALYKAPMDSPEQSASGDRRSEIMRARLLDATLDVIRREGWARASTPKICEQAGVSRGAQTHHYPTKTALLMAAIDKVSREYEAEIQRRMAELDPDQRTLRAVLEVVWESCLDDRFMQSSIEAMVAGRTDPELRGPISALDNEAITSLRSLVDQIEVPAAPAELLQDTIELSLYLFRGIVVQRGMHDDEKYQRRLFDVWCGLVESALERALPPAQ